jgi:hypothetical protein
MTTGPALIETCKQHILDVMASLPECAADGPGLGQRAIEQACGFELNLPGYDGYFTWSLLVSLATEGRVEAFQPGKRNKKYRLVRG